MQATARKTITETLTDEAEKQEMQARIYRCLASIFEEYGKKWQKPTKRLDGVMTERLEAEVFKGCPFTSYMGKGITGDGYEIGVWSTGAGISYDSRVWITASPKIFSQTREEFQAGAFGELLERATRWGEGATENAERLREEIDLLPVLERFKAKFEALREKVEAAAPQGFGISGQLGWSYDVARAYPEVFGAQR